MKPLADIIITVYPKAEGQGIIEPMTTTPIHNISQWKFEKKHKNHKNNDKKYKNRKRIFVGFL